MTRRAWTILAVDLAAAAAFGGAVLSGGGSSPIVIEPSPAGLFSDAQWQTVQSRVVRRGFDPAGIRVVGGTMLLPQRQPFALIAGTAHARQCFVPVRGVALGRTVCSVSKPMLVFTAPGRMTAVIGLAGRGVVALAIEDRAGHVTGLPLVSVGGILTFAGGASVGRILRAYGADGHVLERMKLRA